MYLFKKRKEKIVIIRVFSKEQKEAFFDILNEGPEKAILISKNSYSIDYKIIFRYTLNFNGFMLGYKSLYPKYKFKILSIE
jgi:hypothetical protein